MNEDFDAATAAAPLLTAWQGGARPQGLSPCPRNLRDAYAVQRAVMQGLGDPGGLWKMALLEGRDRQAATLPRRILHASGAAAQLPADTAIEVETALVLSCEPDAADPMAAIAKICLAFELVAPRYASGAAFTPLEGMADGFRSAGVVLGDPIDGWRDGLPDRLDITLMLDGDTVSVAEAAAPMDQAMDFLGWLAGHARSQGMPLKAGDVIITGARIGPLPLNGATYAYATALGARVAFDLSCRSGE